MTLDPSNLTNQEKLEQVYEMTVENNKILRSLRTQQHIANFFRFIYWMVIIISLGGAYFYIKPIISAFTTSGSNIDQTFKQLNELRSQIPEARLFDKMLKRDGGGDAGTTTQAQ